MARRLVSDDAWAILTILQEADASPQEERIAVGEVIRDRTKLKYNSNGTISGTCLKAGQFSGWDTKDPNRIRVATADLDDPIVQACAGAWATAMKGSSFAKGALLYYAPKAMKPPGSVPWWVPDCVQVAAVGSQLFFRPKKV